MNRITPQQLLFAMGLLLIALVWAVVYYARDEWKLYGEQPDDDIEVPSLVERNPDGLTSVRLTAAAQTASGIELGQPLAVRAGTEHEAQAAVLDLEPLFALRGLLHEARADIARLAAQLARAETERDRVQALFSDDRNVSERTLQTARSQVEQDRAALAAARARADGLHARLVHGWGPLAGSATGEAPDELERLADRRNSLVAVALRGSGEAPPLMLLRLPDGNDAIEARRIGPAPRSLAQAAGETWLYKSERVLPTGTRLAARGVTGETMLSLVPNSAVVWYAGLPWVYVRDDDEPEEFTRQALPADSQRPDGWLAPKLEDDARVVTRGAQLLLSEELKHTLADENDD
ncbi:hypothetical protein [Methyloversatilis sp.]|uniref:hypothetical protein n=1 Tax=Methyloversatilis sp. TaxID=2569862 RepID=UPI002733F65D|nr:hypothetical protein [Methyloversatilis sp.]MDP2868986.1 hypothetical protein [Methyloversatilis sp.]MDP3454835.1 hypothetical protein [Methyloversatilis sp.]MDP3577007.1 hypothetical protein [Methyloversatilis sp.]